MLINPLMLAWTGGAVVPLVLHLLSRSRYRPVPWGAMMFLTGRDSKTHYADRARQWSLLLLRMGLIGLLAVALARPVVSARYESIPTAGLTTGGPAAVVIILDDSPSMGYTRDGKSRLDLAREVTLQILSSLKRGDQAALLITGRREYQQATPPNADLQSIAAKVADLQPDVGQGGQADFATDLSRAADLLEHAKPADHEIYLITDQPAIHWRAVSEAFKQRWTARRAVSPPFRITVFPVGSDEADNVAIDAIDFAERVVIRGQFADLQIHVHNYGPGNCDAVPLSVWSGSRTLGQFNVSVPGRSLRTVNVPVRFEEAGSYVISAAMRSTGLTSDDRLDYAVDVSQPLRTLLVDDSAPQRLPIQLMLMPPLAADLHSVNSADVTEISLNQLDAEVIRNANVVILNDVPALRGDQTKWLQQFVTDGGGILFLPGENAARDLKISSLYQAGTPILPITLSAPLAPSKPKAGSVTTLDRSNPVFHFVDANTDPFSRLVTSRYFPIVSRPKESHALARFGSNEPFLVEHAIGHGRILLMTSAVDSSWNAMAKTNMFQNLMQSMVRYLGAGAVTDRNLWPGQAINVSLNETVDDQSATVQFSSTGQRDPASVTRVNNRSEIRYSHTGKPGVYRLRYRVRGIEKTLNFVVNTGHTETDLTPLTEDQWRTMNDRVGFDRVDLARMTVAQAIDRRRGGREIWIELLSGVLILMMLEMGLSRWWSRRE